MSLVEQRWSGRVRGRVNATKICKQSFLRISFFTHVFLLPFCCVFFFNFSFWLCTARCHLFYVLTWDFIIFSMSALSFHVSFLESESKCGGVECGFSTMSYSFEQEYGWKVCCRWHWQLLRLLFFFLFSLCCVLLLGFQIFPCPCMEIFDSPWQLSGFSYWKMVFKQSLSFMFLNFFWQRGGNAFKSLK